MQIGIDVFIFLLSIWCLVLLCVYSWRFWLMYAQQKNIASIKWVMLEVRIPREVFKSPAAMEIALHALLQAGGVGTWYHRNIMGNVPIYSSLEIVSLEGSVHFYVRAQRKFKQLIQNNLYSQYPSIEITEAEDYISKVFFEHRTKSNDVSLWGITWTPTNTFDTGVENPKGKKGENGKRENYKMSGDYKMFKTYVDYGLDKDPKEEFKNDPLTPVLEWLGSLGKGEYGWYQILVTDEGNYNNSKYPAHYVLEHEHKHVQLKEIAKLRIAQLRGEKKSEIKFKKGDVILDEYGRAKTTRDAEGKEVPLTTLVDIYEKSESKKEGDMRPEEKDEIESIYRKISKPIVLCVFRTAYLNTKKQGDFVENIQSTLSNVKQYGQAGFNGFKPRPTDPYEYKWEDVDKHRKPWRAEEFYESYVEREGYMPHIMPRPAVDKFWDLRFWNRSMGFRKITRIMYDTFFHPFDHPHATDVFALNLEELATFWHLPGQVATTPGIARIDSIKSEAPINLPM